MYPDWFQILGFFFAGVVLNQFGLIRNLTDVKILSEWGILFLVSSIDILHHMILSKFMHRFFTRFCNMKVISIFQKTLENMYEL